MNLQVFSFWKQLMPDRLFLKKSSRISFGLNKYYDINKLKHFIEKRLSIVMNQEYMTRNLELKNKLLKARKFWQRMLNEQGMKI